MPAVISPLRKPDEKRVETRHGGIFAGLSISFLAQCLMIADSRYNNYLFLLLALVLLITGLIVPRALSFMPGLLGLIFCACLYFRQKTLIVPSCLHIGLVGFLSALVALSGLWAIAPDDTLERAFKLLLLLGSALFWIAAARSAALPDSKILLHMVIISYCFLALLLSFERNFDMPISYAFFGNTEADIALTRLNRSLVVLSLMLVPVLSLVPFVSDSKKIRLAWISLIFMSLIFAILFSKSQTAQLAAIIGAVFYFLVPLGSRMIWRIMTVAIVFLCLSSPFIINALDERGKEVFAQNSLTLEASVPHRLEIWGFVSGAIMEKPWLGYGVEATRYMHSQHWMKYMDADNVLHPHNATLQIWLEFGLLGAFVYIAFLLYLLKLCRALPSVTNQRLALATYMSALCMANTGYGLWQSWQLGLFMALAGFVILINNGRDSLKA